MAAALKQQTAQPEVSADLSELHTVELAKILYDESRGSARAMAAYQEIANRQALADLKREMDGARWSEDQKKGTLQVKANAVLMREDWHKKAVAMLTMYHLTRKQLIAALVEYSAGRYRGKDGDIKEGTVRGWLTARTEFAIREEAHNKISSTAGGSKD